MKLSRRTWLCIDEGFLRWVYIQFVDTNCGLFWRWGLEVWWDDIRFGGVFAWCNEWRRSVEINWKLQWFYHLRKKNVTTSLQFESSSHSLQPPFQSLAEGHGLLHPKGVLQLKALTHLQCPEPLDVSVTTLQFRPHCKQQSRRTKVLQQKSWFPFEQFYSQMPQLDPSSGSTMI